MEDDLPKRSEGSNDIVALPREQKNRKHRNSTGRDWKEYLGESLLIIFSVVFASAITELINKIHDKQRTREILAAVRTELENNHQKEKVQYQYHLQVLRNIDSALADESRQRSFIENGVLNIRTVIPDGVLREDLDDVSWQVAKQDNIFTKIALSEYLLLTDIYDNQARITKSEQEIANVLLSRESRTAADNRITLLLLHDNYHGWAVDRVPGLLKKYETAIAALGKYKE